VLWSHQYGIHDNPGIHILVSPYIAGFLQIPAIYLFLVPVIVLAMGYNYVLNSLSARKKMFGLITIANMTNTLSSKLTQVAVGCQASEDTRLLCEWIWAGAIGPVRQVHNWSARPFWPQGLDRPKETHPVPEGLDWNLWLGPAPLAAVPSHPHPRRLSPVSRLFRRRHDRLGRPPL
jgi:hypothetical protein